jgi:hypothetical protein
MPGSDHSAIARQHLHGDLPGGTQVRNVAGFNLDPSHRTLAKLLQERGWQTAAFVGAAVLAKTTGLNQGFQTYDDTMKTPELGVASPQLRAGRVIDRALEWLAKQSHQSPFFCGSTFTIRMSLMSLLFLSRMNIPRSPTMAKSRMSIGSWRGFSMGRCCHQTNPCHCAVRSWRKLVRAWGKHAWCISL